MQTAVTAHAAEPGVGPTLEGPVPRVARRLLAILGIAWGCRMGPSVPVLEAQEAAVTFLLSQRDWASTACLLVARAPGELEDGFVSKNLEDPPPDSIGRLSSHGLDVRPFSACSTQGMTRIVLRVGWPKATPEGFEVPVDLLCGPLGCDGGFRVYVHRTDAGVRGVGAQSTWVS